MTNAEAETQNYANELQERQALISRLLESGADYLKISAALVVFDAVRHPEPEAV